MEFLKLPNEPLFKICLYVTDFRVHNPVFAYMYLPTCLQDILSAPPYFQPRQPKPTHPRVETVF